MIIVFFFVAFPAFLFLSAVVSLIIVRDPAKRWVRLDGFGEWARFAGSCAFFPLLFAFLSGAFNGILGVKDQAYFKKHGLPATGTLIDVTDTNVTINNNPQVNLMFKVAAKGRKPYIASSTMTVPRTGIGYLREGTKFRLMIDKNVPSDIMVLGPERAPAGRAH